MKVRKSLCLHGEMISVYSLNKTQARNAEELYVNHPRLLCFQCKYFEWKLVPPHVIKKREEWKYRDTHFIKKSLSGAPNMI